METRLTLRPGQNGTRKLTERFGRRLVCVRYRYDETLRKRCTTVELIVAESEWTPRRRKPRASRRPEDMVYIRVGYAEEGLPREAQGSRRPLAPAAQALGAPLGRPPAASR